MDEIIDKIIDPDTELWQQIRAVHDWMVKNIAYDTTFTYYHATDALAGRDVVCQGYAELFFVFMGELDVPCRMVTGTAYNSSGSGESHAWNAVQLNGAWYYVDVTWDDPLMLNEASGEATSDYPDGFNLRYDYFLVTSDSISGNHKAETALPAPSGTDTSYNEQAVALLRKELIELAAANARAEAGEGALVYAITADTDIDALLEQISAAAAEKAGAGSTEFVISVAYDRDVIEFNDLSEKIFESAKKGINSAGFLFGGGSSGASVYSLYGIAKITVKVA